MWQLSCVLANIVNQKQYVIPRGNTEMGAAIGDLQDVEIAAPVTSIHFSSLCKNQAHLGQWWWITGN